LAFVGKGEGGGFLGIRGGDKGGGMENSITLFPARSLKKIKKRGEFCPPN
jgi:hypothetical protein